MKKVFTNWKMSLSALLLVGGMMLVSNSAQAQGGITSSPVANVDVKGAGTWVFESNAIQLVKDELSGPINTALEQLPVGSSQYFVWKYKAIFYEAVLSSLLDGVGTSKSVRVNFDRLAGSTNAEPVVTPLSQAEWQGILNEMVDLLSN